MEKFLREWRQDALNKAQYDSAIFVGDKLLALTNDDGRILSRYDEALGLLGDRNPVHLIANASNKRKVQHTGLQSRHAALAKGGRMARDEAAEEESANRKYEAAMCYLRGICYAKQNAFDRAKDNS
ncbi:hypothetical protein HYQ46_001392 [Verticillium longisporum]|nr:hypothetical protein HYQ46_001392 [Verticillium longisporum]